MENNKTPHSFHIPVMGLSFTIDSPIKVAQYGISSVISIVDDVLIEKMREYYCNRFNFKFKPITTKDFDFRAERITAYLNLVDKIVKDKFQELKDSFSAKGNEIEKYFNLLPSYSSLKQKFNSLIESKISVEEIQAWLKENLSIGSIDVNIMTKLDKVNYKKKEKLPSKFNDAHAALRGFANSNLNSSIILSAGINPRLYSYIANFDDFYPDKTGEIKKKIVVKVSDYRSALIQGKFFAKKGLWVSEYRVESGLNCGGHAFASDGYLMGPILDEFKNNRNTLISEIHEILITSLKKQNRFVPKEFLDVKFTAQGGVGTAEEHKFLLDHYKLDSVGWGTPFLLVPEATTVDDETRERLIKAKEDDLHISKISPLGISFNSLKTNTKDVAKQKLINEGKPGSSCPKKYLVSNTEFTDEAICTASRKYQSLKIEELNNKNLSEANYKKQYEKIVVKSCLCVGLASSALIANDLKSDLKEEGVSICPGPNLAYFSNSFSLKDMIGHIYGKVNIMHREDRPNMFVKELQLYLEYLYDKISETAKPFSDKEVDYFVKFSNNIEDGIKYYKSLFSEIKSAFNDIKSNILNELDLLEMEIRKINYELIPVKNNYKTPMFNRAMNS